MTTTLTTGGRRAALTWRDPLARAGIVARGVLYLVLGFLAIQFARGEVGSEQVNQTGAFAKVAEQPFGKFLLVAMIVGLAAMTLWRLIQTFVGDPVEGDEAKDRVEYFVKAVIYGFLTFTAAKITIDNWSGPAGGTTAAQDAGDGQQQQATSTLFDLPAGRVARRRPRRRADRHRPVPGVRARRERRVHGAHQRRRATARARSRPSAASATPPAPSC